MLNMDFSKRVVINSNQQPWVASPLLGVWRAGIGGLMVSRGIIITL